VQGGQQREEGEQKRSDAGEAQLVEIRGTYQGGRAQRRREVDVIRNPEMAKNICTARLAVSRPAGERDLIGDAVGEGNFGNGRRRMLTWFRMTKRIARPRRRSTPAMRIRLFEGGWHIQLPIIAS